MLANRAGLLCLLMLAAGLFLVGLLPKSALGNLHPDRSEDIVFAGSATYAPFQWLDAQGQAKGFVIDLQDAMAQQGGVTAEHRLTAWETALHAVESGEADAVALFASERRRQQYDFTNPFYHQFHSIFSHTEGERFSNLDALRGKTVAVTTAGYAQEQLAEEHPDIRLYPVKSERACILAVHAREADACVEATLSAKRLAADYDVRSTSSPFWPRPYVFAVRKGNSDLLEWLNFQLAAMQSDGIYFAIYQKWLPELEWRKPTIADHLNTLAWIIAPILLLALLGLIGAWVLKRQVARKTRQLTTELQSRRRLEKQLRDQAEYDAATGLPNRQAFIDDLERRLNEAPDWSPTLVFLRLQSLDSVTSTFGRTGHEKLIKDYGYHVEHLGFPLVSHLGTGTFALITPQELSPEETMARLTTSFYIEGLYVDPGVVMGISIGRAGDGGKDSASIHAEELLRRAVTAYASAHAKGNTWCVYTPQLQPDPRDLILLHDFRQHGTRDMRLVYQPKLDLASGRIREAEALIRWEHPRLGFISPGHFIPLLEKAGMITRLTRWVIDEAIEELARCRTRDPDFGISVNIAAQDLSDGAGLVGFLRDKRTTSLQGLRLEITETGVIQDHDHTQRVIATLREIGIDCAVDDFGTGYASLSYLSRFPIEEVKLDRSFIRNMRENRRDYAIVASTIELAHTLGLKVTAEGIEDQATLEALAELGCDTAQGYVISHPIAAEEVYRMMGKHYLEWA
ncbi:putative bifunctional diguanylate cyclase/phosphodiesterase [Billgrantia bachuensis]|uniref:EAL domain-containing protein n=1 Tax=Billgrantia bachuensis TaxID=2717286 RepID=A0ABX0PV44_9GAMM|nr:EAL domain-containing protein [Halomonas bachuensis]NIC07155.1 EAL domain-containing protein [Halomonas bachuensis]